MPRANRNFIPGHIWHITQRCHKKEFLLKFSKDKRSWVKWLYEARKRYGLCVLNYIVTSNHIHLLVYDRDGISIPKSLQLISGRAAQQYNQRKNRNGAFWEDRYHATAVDSDSYLAQCLVYIDLNMVRAGVVNHPAEWRYSGYAEIQEPPERKRIIDIRKLMSLLGIESEERLRSIHSQWVEDELEKGSLSRNSVWTESVAVGSKEYVLLVKSQLGTLAEKKCFMREQNYYQLKEPESIYS